MERVERRGGRALRYSGFLPALATIVREEGGCGPLLPAPVSEALWRAHVATVLVPACVGPGPTGRRARPTGLPPAGLRAEPLPEPPPSVGPGAVGKGRSPADRSASPFLTREPRGAERSREEPRGAERSREEPRGAESRGPRSSAGCCLACCTRSRRRPCVGARAAKGLGRGWGAGSEGFGARRQDREGVCGGRGLRGEGGRGGGSVPALTSRLVRA